MTYDQQKHPKICPKSIKIISCLGQPTVPFCAKVQPYLYLKLVPTWERMLVLESTRTVPDGKFHVPVAVHDLSIA